MRIAVTGSIATDHLMTFPGRFADQLVADQLHTVSLSFLVDNLDVRRGGVGAEHLPSAWASSAPARSWSAPPAPTSTSTAPGWTGTASTPTPSGSPRSLHTARFVCTTDADHNQIGSFYTGAMSEARLIELQAGRRPGRRPRPGPRSARTTPRRCSGTPRSAARAAIPFAADFSQQIARMDGDDIRILLDGADVPLLQRVREGPHRVQDRLERRGDPRQGRHPGHHARRAAASASSASGEEPDRGRLPGGGAPRPTRPASATPSAPASCPAWPGASAWSAPRRSAACWPRWSSRRSAPRSTQLRRGHFMERFTKAYGDEAAAEVQRTCT